MTRARTAGALLVLLGLSLLTRIGHHAGVPLQQPNRAAVGIHAEEKLLAIETVDLKNGNLHLQIPIRATHTKPTVLRSDH